MKVWTAGGQRKKVWTPGGAEEDVVAVECAIPALVTCEGAHACIAAAMLPPGALCHASCSICPLHILLQQEPHSEGPAARTVVAHGTAHAPCVVQGGCEALCCRCFRLGASLLEGAHDSDRHLRARARMCFRMPQSLNPRASCQPPHQRSFCVWCPGRHVSCISSEVSAIRSDREPPPPQQSRGECMVYV